MVPEMRHDTLFFPPYALDAQDSRVIFHTMTAEDRNHPDIPGNTPAARRMNRS